MGVTGDVDHLVERDFVVVGLHVALFVAEVHLVPERGHVVAGALADECSSASWGEVDAVAVFAVAGPAVLVEQLSSALDVGAFDLPVLVQQFVDKVCHSFVLNGECVALGTGCRGYLLFLCLLWGLFWGRGCTRRGNAEQRAVYQQGQAQRREDVRVQTHS